MSAELTPFETEFCGRCNGTGRHNYCQTWGTTCFDCGTKPGEPGTGRRFTKRGAVAHRYYLDSLPRKMASEIAIGDVVWDPGITRGRWVRVIGIEHATREWYENGVRIEGAVIVLIFPNLRFYVAPTTPLMVEATPEQRATLRAQALAFQSTLTKRGTPRKRGARGSSQLGRTEVELTSPDARKAIP